MSVRPNFRSTALCQVFLVAHLLHCAIARSTQYYADEDMERLVVGTDDEGRDPPADFLDDGGGHSDDSGDDDNFYARNAKIRDWLFTVFRFGLFLFILCFPCIRAIRVWFIAGGRFQWRRTESGWIVGLRYVPADLDRWLILSGYSNQTRPSGSGAAPVHRKLTPAEVYALPEIDAPAPPPQPNDDNETTTQETVNTDDDIELGTVAIGKSKDQEDDGDDAGTTPDHHSESAPPTAAASWERASTDGSIDPSIDATTTADSASSSRAFFTTTLSTSCSICLDDFEEAETIRLLPRCGHAFHTDCILPWLTERQGCCPYCKTEVTICPPATTPNNATTTTTTTSASVGIDESVRIRLPTSSTSTSTRDHQRTPFGRWRTPPRRSPPPVFSGTTRW